MILRRPVLAPPRFAGLDAGLQVRIERANARLETLRLPTAERVIEADPSLFAPLHHRLSREFAKLHRPQSVRLRSPAERLVLNRHANALARADASSFPSLLISIASAATGSPTPFRNGAMFLGADPQGNRIQLPRPEHLRERLEVYRQLMSVDAREQPLFAGVVTLACLVNCHPFPDGNGRVARILFNNCLRDGGMGAAHYLPFYELARQSCGGYEICLRLAEIRGEWEPLLDWTIAAVEICRQLSD